MFLLKVCPNMLKALSWKLLFYSFALHISWYNTKTNKATIMKFNLVIPEVVGQKGFQGKNQQYIFERNRKLVFHTSSDTPLLLQHIQRLWVIWGQCCPGVAAAPSLPNGPITQLSPYFTRKPGIWNSQGGEPTMVRAKEIKYRAFEWNRD